MQQGFSVNNQSGEAVPLVLKVLKSRLSHILLLTLAILAIYFNTFNVPFYFDDQRSIVENAVVHDLNNFNWLNLFSLQGFILYVSNRFLTLYTIALNYRFNGLDVTGYHIVNTFIHILTTITAYFLTRALLGTEKIRRHCTENQLIFIPLLASLLFAIHPLQTQSVTYIIQRAASLAALGYLGSMLFYITGRSSNGIKQVLCYAAALLLGLLALLSKQNAFTFPLVILLAELLLFRQSKKFFMIIGSIFIVSLLLLVTILILNTELTSALSTLSRETFAISRGEYLNTQALVLCIYIAKFLIPINLHLEYFIAPVENALNPTGLLLGACHLAAISSAIYFRNRSPVLSFSVLFYYTTHLVESSIIPINDLAVEHRTYLPNYGLVLMTSWIVLFVMPRLLPGRFFMNIRLVIITGVLLLFSSLTISRNQQWNDPVTFYENEIAINPQNLRVWSLLGEVYIAREDFAGAVEIYDQAVTLIPDFSDYTNTTLTPFFLNYIIALDTTGNPRKALDYFGILDFSTLPPGMRSRYMTVRANIHNRLENFDAAETDYIEAIRLDNNNLQAKLGYGILLILTERQALSLPYIQEVYARDPSNEQARQILDYLRTL